jgi:type VI secretion system protein ImpH
MAAARRLQGAVVMEQSRSSALGATVGSAASAGPPQQLGPLYDALQDNAAAFDFFQAVRTLERLHPNREGPGHFVDPDREVVRFSVNPSIAFPPTEIHALQLAQDGPARLSVNFFGLTGPQAVLPYEYSLLVSERLRARDAALSEFLDLFHHRLISLFYRAWERNRFTVRYEKREDPLLDHLLDLVGLGLDVERRRVAARETLPSYAGLLGPQPRSALALQQLLEDMFDVPVEVEQFVGGWYRLASTDQCALGEEDDASGQLGLGAVAGDEVWDQQARVRLRVGPMNAERYTDFLPTGSAHALLRWVVRNFSRDAFDFELQLVLDRADVPGCVLGEDEAEPQPLGWSTWLRTATFARDPDDTIVRL